MACNHNNTCLHIRVSLLSVGINILHLSIPLLSSGKLYERVWKTQHESEDREMLTLSKTLPFVIESGLAATSNKKYFRGWKYWADWSNSIQEVISCPAFPFYLAICLNPVLFTSSAKGSIITVFYGIRWGHHVMGFNSPTDNPFVQLAFEGCQRLCETETTKKKNP